MKYEVWGMKYEEGLGCHEKIEISLNLFRNICLGVIEF